MKQLIVFFLLAYAISWGIWLPLYADAFGLPAMKAVPFNHGLGGLGPFLAAVITTRVFQQHKLGNLLTRCFRIRPILYFLIALLSPFALALLASAISTAVDDTPAGLEGLLSTKEFPDLGLFSFFIYTLLFFGFGEETGWRGFALPRLQLRLGALRASVVLSLLWALWHWPLFLYRPGYLQMDAAGVLGWIFSLVTGSVLLTWLYNSSRGSILICAVFHTTIDMAFTADFADPRIVHYMGFLIIVWGILTVIFFKARTLGGGHVIRR